MCPRQPTGGRPIRFPARILAATTTALALITTGHAATDWRTYAKTEAAKAPYRWTGAQWDALDSIIRPESAWNPCASYPSRHDCFYSGSSSCGIPQANPCPYSWRGRLGASAKEQVKWLLNYVKVRYGSPLNALYFRRTHGYY